MSTLAYVGLIVAGIFAWFIIGGVIAYQISKILTFDQWRYKTSDGEFRQRFSAGSEADFGAIWFGPLALFVFAYHLWAVDWTKEQRQMYREIKQDDDHVMNAKEQQAMDTLRSNHERNREKRLRQMERHAGIDPQ